MALGRNKDGKNTDGKAKDDDRAVDAAADDLDDDVDAVTADDEDGPFDIEDFDDPEVAAQGRLDLGSVLIPMPADGQLQVELNPAGVPAAIWVLTPNGRFTIAGYAALSSPV